MHRTDAQVELFARGGDPDSDRATIDRLAAVCGIEAARKFARVFGGSRVYLPLHVTEFHPIAEAIGIEAARAVCRSFGGETIEVPILKSRAQRRRDRDRILALRDQGVNNEEIARRVGCSRRHVYDVLREE